MSQKPIKKVYFCDGAVNGKISSILQQHYEVIVTDKDPNYIFYSCMGFEHLDYNGIRIFSTGENVRADFNFCDYAIGFDYISFEDRYLRYPLYLHCESDMQKVTEKHLHITPKILQDKTRFCTFVVSNGKADEKRTQFFDFLNQYNRVDSGGRYKNNIGKPVADKYAFLKEGKFNIAFENSSTNGYTTEKLFQAFASHTIPIYWGDERISMPLNVNGGGVNAKSFINIHQYKTFEEVLESIIYLNTHDEAYLQMLSEPVFLDVNHKDLFDKRLENFLLHIFDQPLEKAYRRGFGQWRCNIEKRYKKAQKARQIGNNIANIIQKPIRILKKYILSAYNFKS
ncbi:glycosyltransferase family 10 domain-containing protein [Helicobacter japonicus]|uniref:glycosyltransferase family 10 domain-containing protein n=1 Tax=Helicobacter japonicus TaxID=425400 RepID=UPI0023F359BB|nr:glycosyltransferase family 10 [Helicobacter japonicus]